MSLADLLRDGRIKRADITAHLDSLDAPGRVAECVVLSKEQLKRLWQAAASDPAEVQELVGEYQAHSGGKITLLPNLSSPEHFSVLAHEVAHELLHRTERRASTTHTIRETEAEAVAFVVSSAIGLDSNTSSSDYIQLHAGDKATLAESLATRYPLDSACAKPVRVEGSALCT